ncbi:MULTISPECIES: hypothetical protein [unclassified Bradyrhizobium]|uniref:hypothetical protein n=1 Tax=unclassified Bradyrhizobium TaxID=2631580 RepID=UPI0033934006
MALASGADDVASIAVRASAPSSAVVNIPAGATGISDILDFRAGYRLAGIIVPAAWLAAVVTFQWSPDGTTWYDMYKADGTEYSVTPVAGKLTTIPVVDFIACRYLQLRSGTSAAPVNQTATRAITVIGAG